MRDLADCRRCLAAVEQLHLNVSDAWFWQHLRSCYRCRTSPHVWDETKHVDSAVSQFLFLQFGLRSLRAPAAGSGQADHAAYCSLKELKDCDLWGLSQPVVPRTRQQRLSSPDDAPTGLIACNACLYSSQADAQNQLRISYNLITLMFNSTGRAVLAPAKDIGLSRSMINNPALLASTESSSIDCWVCYLWLHSRVHSRDLAGTKWLQNCMAFMSAAESFEDTKQMLMSKAAAVYHNGAVRRGSSSWWPGWTTAAMRPIVVDSSSSSSSRGATADKTQIDAARSCNLCLGWIEMHDVPCRKDPHLPGTYPAVPTQDDCNYCMSSSAQDDATALWRSTVHYQMACALLGVCLTEPKVLALWLQPDVQPLFFSTAAAEHSDLSQQHVLLTSYDLQQVQGLLDKAIDGSTVGQTLMSLRAFAFDYNSSLAGVAVMLFGLLAAFPSVLAIKRHLTSKRSKRRSVAGRRQQGILTRLWQWPCCLVSNVVGSVVRVLARIQWKLVFGRAAGVVVYAVLREFSLRHLHGVPIIGSRIFLQQQPELSMFIDLVVVPCVLEVCMPCVNWVNVAVSAVALAFAGSGEQPAALADATRAAAHTNAAVSQSAQQQQQQESVSSRSRSRKKNKKKGPSSDAASLAGSSRSSSCSSMSRRLLPTDIEGSSRSAIHPAVLKTTQRPAAEYGAALAPETPTGTSTIGSSNSSSSGRSNGGGSSSGNPAAVKLAAVSPGNAVTATAPNKHLVNGNTSSSSSSQVKGARTAATPAGEFRRCLGIMCHAAVAIFIIAHVMLSISLAVVLHVRGK
jgi:hypothetical protein